MKDTDRVIWILNIRHYMFHIKPEIFDTRYYILDVRLQTIAGSYFI